jgi:hypothetical protein
MPTNILVVNTGNNVLLFYDGSMLLALANRVNPPAGTLPALGTGTYQDPFVLQGLAEWIGPAPLGAKRIFMNIGGRMLMKRVNRGPDGWDGYVTDLGPLAAAQQRLAVQGPFKAQFGSSATVAANPPRGPHHRTDAARKTDPRWYMEGGIEQNDPMYDPQVSHLLGADYSQISASLNDYMNSTGEGDFGIARKMRQVINKSDSIHDLPPSAALLCTAWFCSESVRHPRSMLSSFILLKLIEDRTHIQLPTPQVGVTISTQVRFSSVIEHSSHLPHPMTGKGTVQDSKKSRDRSGLFGKTLESDRNITAASEKRSLQNLSTVEKREAEIFMEWLSRKLVHYGGFTAQKVSQQFAEIALPINPQDNVQKYEIRDDAHPSLHPAQRPAVSAQGDQNIIDALTSAL